jgi:hypothetical protein
VLLSLVLLAVAAPAAEAASTLTVVAGERTVTRIGSFRPGSDPTIAAAERAFGEASSIRDVGEGCRVDWRRLRLRMYFANFGSIPPERGVCHPRIGKAQTFTVRGPRLRTWRGLRVGQRSSAVRRRHPAARFREGTWWLRSAVSQVGTSSEYAVMRALTSGGRVRSLSGWIGAAGD